MDSGLKDEVRVDYGTERALMLFMQSQLEQFRNDLSKPLYVQSTSKLVDDMITSIGSY